jgi:DNA gyrase subunit A
MCRATQGVRLINIKGKDSIAAVEKVMQEDDEDEDVLNDDSTVISDDSINEEE